MNSLANPSLVAYLPLRREGKPPYRDREVRAIAGLFCYLKPNQTYLKFFKFNPLPLDGGG
jgi:hypothetical protein